MVFTLFSFLEIDLQERLEADSLSQNDFKSNSLHDEF